MNVGCCYVPVFGFRSARQLAFDDGSHGNTENIPPQMLGQLQASAAKQPGLRQQVSGAHFQQAGNQGFDVQQPGSLERQCGSKEAERPAVSQGARQNTSLNSSIRTPSSFIVPSHPSSGESFDRVSFHSHLNIFCNMLEKIKETVTV